MLLVLVKLLGTVEQDPLRRCTLEDFPSCVFRVLPQYLLSNQHVLSLKGHRWHKLHCVCQCICLSVCVFADCMCVHRADDWRFSCSDADSHGWRGQPLSQLLSFCIPLLQWQDSTSKIERMKTQQQRDFEGIKQSYNHIMFNTHLANSK